MFQWDAIDYQKNSEAQLEWGRELIAKLNLKGTERVLDIGCGDGKVTAEIAAALPDGFVTGIDSSSEMIDLACETFPCDRCRNIRFALKDALDLNFSEEFDVVFSNAVLHWVKDHLQVLKGIYRSLRRPGRIMLQMGGRGNVSEMTTAILSLMNQGKWKGYYTDFVPPWGFYTPEQYGPWLEEAGFKPLRVELITKDMTHRGRDGLIAWLRSTWLPFTQRIPAELREIFIGETVDKLLEGHPLDGQGLAHMKAVRLEVEAVK